MRLWGTAADVVRQSLHPCLDIGNWDMNATDAVDVDVGVHYSRWRTVTVLIRDDLGTTIKKLGWKGSLSGWFHHDPVKGDTILTLERKIGGDFDSIDYDTAVYNRGYISMCVVP